MSLCIFLKPLNCFSENVSVKAVIVPELRFRDIQRQILLADLVEAASDAALEQAPEALNPVH